MLLNWNSGICWSIFLMPRNQMKQKVKKLKLKTQVQCNMLSTRLPCFSFDIWLLTCHRMLWLLLQYWCICVVHLWFRLDFTFCFWRDQVTACLLQVSLIQKFNFAEPWNLLSCRIPVTENWEGQLEKPQGEKCKKCSFPCPKEKWAFPPSLYSKSVICIFHSIISSSYF